MPIQPQSDKVARIVLSYAAQIGREGDADNILKLNADMARELSGADRCSIWMVDGKTDELWTRVAHGVPEIRVPKGHGLVGAAVEANEVIVVNDTASDPRFSRRTDKGSGYATQSVLVIPLVGGDGAVIGALQALNKPGGFAQDDLDLLNIAAGYSASALETLRLRLETESARLLRRELEIAKGVQERLLPQSAPQVKGIEVAGYCRPASFVGGDYYDFVAMPDGSLLLTLGDVAGKGVAACVLMASLQASLRTKFDRVPESVAAAISEFNKSVCALSSDERYSTLFCGLYDPDRARLTYVNGGHVNPLLRRGGGQVEHLDIGGPPIGLFSFAQYSQGQVPVLPGDLLVTVSDGISEAQNPSGELWDEGSLQQVVSHCGALTPAQVVERLVQAADAFASGAAQNDDMTVIAARFV